MFSGITTYLFGGCKNDDDMLQRGKENEIYTTVDTDGDWLLVEKCKQVTSSSSGTVESDSECLVPLPATAKRDEPSSIDRYNLSTHAEALSSCVHRSIAFVNIPPSSTSPTPVAACLESSWFITPPSCFTAGSPSIVETSPLENLLIEHPSMSVYGSISNVTAASSTSTSAVAAVVLAAVADSGRSVKAVQELCQLQASDLPRSRSPLQPTTTNEVSRVNSRLGHHQTPTSGEVNNGGADRHGKATRSHKRPAQAINPLPSNKTGLLMQIQNQAPAQKLKQRQEMKLVHLKQLERLNKVQEYQSHGKRHRRKDFMKTPSGKSNNRKF